MSAPRLALTTTRERSVELAEIAETHGCEPVILPCIAVDPAEAAVLERVRSGAAEADWLLVVSPTAIAALWPEGGMPNVPVAAVGRSTAAAVEAAGGSVSAVGESGLADLLEDWGARATGQTVVLPHSSLSDLSSFDALGDHVRLVASAVYATRPIAPEADAVDAVVFASPSAVTGWVSSRSLEDLVIAAIGATTAGSLSDGGHPPHVVPPRPDFEMLIDLTARYLRDRSPV